MTVTRRARALLVLLIAAAACRAGGGTTPTGLADGTDTSVGTAAGDGGHAADTAHVADTSAAHAGSAHTVVGTWAQTGLFPGSALEMTLRVDTGRVNGTLQYRMEAGRAGQGTVDGPIHGDSVHLALLYDSGTRAAFDGALTSDSTLDGRLAFASDPGLPLTAHFRRAP